MKRYLSQNGQINRKYYTNALLLLAKTHCVVIDFNQNSYSLGYSTYFGCQTSGPETPRFIYNARVLKGVIVFLQHLWRRRLTLETMNLQGRLALSDPFQDSGVVGTFRGGLIFKAHRLLYHSALGWRVIRMKKRRALFGTLAVIKSEGTCVDWWVCREAIIITITNILLITHTCKP